MRKTQKNIIVLAVLALALVAFCACGVIASATAIKISSYPKTSYTTSDADFDWTGFKLAITTSDGNTTEYTYDQLKNQADFTVSAFDSSVGTHTATITYQTLEATFQYTVAAGTFAGGEGTQANPYQISTVEQFKNIGTPSTYTYFKLINDIDFNNAMTKENGLATQYTSGIGNVEIDGNGYALRNLNSFLGDTGAAGKATVIKNLDMYINIAESGNVGMAIFGNIRGTEVRFENINVYGKMEEYSVGQNSGILINHIIAANTVISKVNIYADMLTTTDYGAPFIGGFNAYGDNAIVTIESSNYYGYAEGAVLDLFVGNRHNFEKLTLTIKNSYNYGKFCVTSSARNYATDSTYNKGTVTVLKDDSLKLTKASDNQLSIVAAKAEVARYVVTATVWTNNGTGTNTYTLIKKDNCTVGATGIYVVDWTYSADKKTTDDAYVEYKDGGYTFDLGFQPYNSNGDTAVSKFGTNAKNRANNVRYTVWAYATDGTLVAAYIYGL